jgi:hypothetical protein
MIIVRGDASCTLSRGYTLLSRELYLASLISWTPNRGDASAVLREAARIADLFGYSIVLDVASSCSLSNEQLVRFYRKRGFKVQSASYYYNEYVKRYKLSCTMVRYPVKRLLS